MGSHRSFHLPESSLHYPPIREFRTKHTKIELDVDFERKRIAGSCTLEIEPIRRGLATAHFDAVGLEISKVSVDGQPVVFEYDGSTLGAPLPPGVGRRKVNVEYSSVPRMGLYFTGPDLEHPEKEVQAWTHTEAEESRYWFPCHDHPADKSGSELVISVPKDFRVISNGRLVSSKVDGPRATFHWVEETPHSCYLTSFIAGKFSQTTQEARGVQLHYNFPESKRDDVLRYFGETPRMIEVFEDITGVKYPYAKYDQTTVEDFVAGGEENLNATTLAMHYYPDAASEEDFSTSYALVVQRPVDLVSHELAHQWFGDYVTCADWAHAWLNEGFASYFQELYLEKTRGVDEAVWHLDTRTEDYFDDDDKEYRRPIVDRDYVWPDDLFDSHLYPKAAARLHELRFIMGDEAFFEGISAYLKDFALSTAETDDLRKTMERVSGLQLEEFFQQAFYKPGHPEFAVDYEWQDQGKIAKIRVKQTQGTDDGTPLFKLPCEIVFYVGGERISRRVLLEAADHIFSFSLAGKPTVVEFDPRRWLLKRVRFEKGLSLLLNQLEYSQDAHSRAEAARGLGSMRNGGAVDGLAKAASKEQFWNVRSAAFKALGEIGTDEALKALLGITPPKNRRARRGLAEALGHFKSTDSRERLVKMLEGDESPFVRCEAALSLAKSWPEGSFPYLKKAMRVNTVNEVLGEACLAAMGRVKGDEKEALIHESLQYGKPSRMRVGALKAIKERGSILENEVPVLKELLLHDREFRVRMQIVEFVVRPLKDRRFLETLEAVSKTDPQLNVRRKALEVCHELTDLTEGAEALASLKAEVEKLREESRKTG